jgi:hypothetical protein
MLRHTLLYISPFATEQNWFHAVFKPVRYLSEDFEHRLNVVLNIFSQPANKKARRLTSACL